MLEFVGEVIHERTFNKRMELYKAKQLKHYYFIMLQKEEVSALGIF